jgi:predicted DNA-binding protein with PD1-like motif
MKATGRDQIDGTSHAIAAGPGEDAITALGDYASEHEIETAQFSAIGEFERATIGWFDYERQAYKQIHVDEPSEVLSLLGGIARGSDGPQVRAQVVLGLADGSTRGGLLLAGTVGPSLDIAIRAMQPDPRRLQPPLRSRQLAIICGAALILLGAWGALSAFIGPSFDFGFAPDQTWQWSSARGWLEVLPGGVAAVGGLVMIISPNRLVIALGGALAAVAGAWFVIGPSFAGLLHIGSLGSPLSDRPGIQSLEWLALFYGLGGAILILVAFVLGRLSTQSFGRAPARRGDQADQPSRADGVTTAAVNADAVTGEIRWEGTPAAAH